MRKRMFTKEWVGARRTPTEKVADFVSRIAGRNLTFANRSLVRITLLAILSVMASVSCYAQFSGSIQGSVQDTTNATIAGATVTLVNVDTKVKQTTTTNSAGVYFFVSLPPGNFTAEASKSGFTTERVPVLLETGERKDVPIVLKVGAETSTVQVSGQAPLLDTSDSRLQLTLNNDEMEALPNSSSNAYNTVDLTPGVIGGMAGQSNFLPQIWVSVSANGRGQNGNVVVLDGSSVNDSTRPGVADFSPNVDAVQETSTQINTYSPAWGSSSSILIQMTSKSGSEHYHGSASEYYQYQGFNARGEYGVPKPTPLAKYHVSNISGTFGGPVPKVKQLFFFASYNPSLQLNAPGGRTAITAPDFVSTYMTNNGNPSPEVSQMLQSFNQPTLSHFVFGNQSDPRNYLTAAQVFNGGTCPTSGTVGPNYLSLPCDTVVDEYGTLNQSGHNTAYQWSARGDKVFSKDRIYVSYFGTSITENNPAVEAAQANKFVLSSYLLQAGYTHDFSPGWLNEFNFGLNHSYAYGLSNQYVDNPIIAIGGMNTYGMAGAGEFDQMVSRYRDVVTHTRGSHTLSFGGDFLYAYQPTNNSSLFGIPYYYYNNPLDVVQGLTDFEGQLSYNNVTGQPMPNQSTYADRTFDLFVEDTWKASRRLTINFGLRYDNFGNPYPLPAENQVTSSTILSILKRPTTGSFQSQIQNAGLVRSNNVFPHDLNWNFGPRVGFSYDVFGNHRSVLRGGVGLFHDWFNLGNAVDPGGNNPPGPYIPNFIRNVTATAPVFSVGTGNNYPYGYVYPSLPTTSVDSKGGLPGQYITIGAVDRNLKSPATINYSLGYEYQLAPTLTAAVFYEGSHSYNQIYNGQSQGNFDLLYDVNEYDGDTYNHPIFNSNGSWNRAQRSYLNTSFGSILYAFNGAKANFNSVAFAVRGRFGKNGFVTASDTVGSAKDNWTQNYNGYQPDGSWNSNSQYGRSFLNATNRVSIGATYEVHLFSHGNRVLREIFSGYQASALGRFQTGGPWNVAQGGGLNVVDTIDGVQLTSANYASELAAGHITYITKDNINSPNVQAAFASGSLASNSLSGDFLGDGESYAFPDVNSYKQVRNRKAFQYKCPASQGCNGSLMASQFSSPDFVATGKMGNERPQPFLNPGYGDVDLAVQKTTTLWRETALRIRMDFFNVANRSNWCGLDNNLSDYATTFATTACTGAARTGQISAKLTF